MSRQRHPANIAKRSATLEAAGKSKHRSINGEGQVKHALGAQTRNPRPAGGHLQRAPWPWEADTVHRTYACHTPCPRRDPGCKLARDHNCFLTEAAEKTLQTISAHECCRSAEEQSRQPVSKACWLFTLSYQSSLYWFQPFRGMSHLLAQQSSMFAAFDARVVLPTTLSPYNRAPTSQDFPGRVHRRDAASFLEKRSHVDM